MSKKYNKTRIKASGALFLSAETKRFLFLLRADDTYTNTWATVGGRVEKHESVIECLAREIQEKIDIPGIKRAREGSYKNHIKIFHLPKLI